MKKEFIKKKISEWIEKNLKEDDKLNILLEIISHKSVEETLRMKLDFSIFSDD